MTLRKKLLQSWVRLDLLQCIAGADTTASCVLVHQTSSCPCRSGTRRTRSAYTPDSAGTVSAAAARLPAPYCQTSPLHSTGTDTTVRITDKLLPINYPECPASRH